MTPNLNQTIEKLDISNISVERQRILQELIDYIESKQKNGTSVHLNFICTHNSRRSQLAQVWAFALASHFGIEVESFSGGIEVTEFNINAVNALQSAGFNISFSGIENPEYTVSTLKKELVCYSKLNDDQTNPKQNFAAIMVCSHADENCPYVYGCDKRIGLTYEDPKEFDGTPKQSEMYVKRSLEIASEMKYVFSNINKV